ncbi:MAG: TIGR04372 family glycosyltransferase [Candidatus Protistobacter heckmanni]|nr:TIGR04372 family glycosyltransferase [Candidatus Protistobacter heckmanni]
MTILAFTRRQLAQIRTGGRAELNRKIRLAWPIVLRLPLTLLGFLLGLPLAVGMRLLKPLCLIRIERIVNWRLGHFAGNMELYLCELDAGINRPSGRFLDLWYHPCPPCNHELARMWKRALHVGPRWLLEQTLAWSNRLPDAARHRIGSNTSHDRDIHDLLDRFPAHLQFSDDEERRGQAGLRAMGIPENARFVCLNVRDDAYLADQSAQVSAKADWSYHDYRNCSIGNYVLAAEQLAALGYFVVRMGALVREPMPGSHPMIIDYATNGMRSEFMDIYLGANCAFCISNGTGFDALPYIFRRPIVYIDHVALGIINTFSPRFLATTKTHWLKRENRPMRFAEIFASGAGYFLRAKDYEEAGIELRESEPEATAAAVMEMEARCSGKWQGSEEDEARQRRFWDVFPKNELHGEIRSRIGADFLRRRQSWLDN